MPDDRPSRPAEDRRARREAREAVLVVQDALLPDGTCVLPGVEIAARYLLAGTAAGGDWFDSVPTSGGRVALVVGDVVGHGVAASAAMAQLRAALAGLLVHDDDPASALARLDRYARLVPDARAATVCVAVLDPASGRVRYGTAGHPPPLVLRGTGGADFLPSPGGAPLGSGQPFPVGGTDLRPGDALVLCTDGLLERPGRTPLAGSRELARVAATLFRDADRGAPAPAVAERVCDGSLEQLVGTTGHDDDVTMICAHLRTTTPAGPALELTAEPTAVAAVHRRMSAWLRQLGVDPASAIGLQHAVGEAVTNAVEHAYAGGQPGPVRLRGRVTGDGEVEVEVADDGCWQALDPRRRGRGLGMAERLVDSFTLLPGTGGAGAGTAVRLRSRVNRPARLLTSRTGAGAAPEPRRTSDRLRVSVAEREPGDARVVVRVGGRVDLRAADTLALSLARARAAAGPDEVVVDLAAVTLLSSGGVRVLAQALIREPGEPVLVLVAPPGTPAHQVLDVVQLPHRAAA